MIPVTLELGIADALNKVQPPPREKPEKLFDLKSFFLPTLSDS